MKFSLAEKLKRTWQYWQSFDDPHVLGMLVRSRVPLNKDQTIEAAFLAGIKKVTLVDANGTQINFFMKDGGK